ncbi:MULTISPECIES: sugar phosphate isomerase/epimerase family protein [Rhizobium]|uniref:Sugar phosphate isomerase/epimerase n=1 Tax=Rhizobium tropici TaxID=398 RepID=A0A6P1CE06_RHITR|nr:MULTISPECIES: sugar phosphate isomerase/epimerase [Rhizobium]AGB74854.1 xylose isomerase-like protein [Rhizobium tropici CIAT 899]MBB4242128.1 sugar phosphate isomerase/epimerase [Rhizobium tropici]MBB5593847.1 sugar phosphate isomerase/epimerase [Rhizobium tropici]MBB6492453.1 sugar phosphate isomerase/epimerase [Rhizobium tropici]NEV14661.1 sugar phosphate isomerase/epimerase [Rhizobium tropici]
MQNLLIFQSLWSMERRSARYPELSLEENIEKIASAGFDGISTHWYDRKVVSRVAGLLKQYGLQAEGQCFPKTVDDLKPVLEIAAEYNVHHICLQPDVRLRRLEDCIPLLEGWQRLAEDAGIDVWIETHRDRMTTDLFFTLDLLDRMPDLRLLGDISHFLVGREFAWPVSDENHALIHRILDSSWAFHGRVASREQVQIEISFPHHRPWVDLFLGWWEYGFKSWKKRANKDATLAFTCELGPKPYAITGRDGEDTTDRWEESLLMRQEILDLWAKVAG